MPTKYTPSPIFEHAASYLSSASALKDVSNMTKLELYSLYKYLTVSPTPTTSKPSIFDYTGRAKWDAWRSAGETYADRAQEAENRYLEIARTLGWSEDKAPEASRDVSERGGEDNIWDDDSATNKRSGDGGMGNFVSTVTHEDTAVSKLSSLAISGNVQGLQSFLDENPRVDVNQPDENGYTPLHLASDRGQLAVVELLLKRGADPDIKDSDNFTAAELAQIAGHDDVLTLLTSV